MSTFTPEAVLAGPIKELEYRGNSAQLVLGAQANQSGAFAVLRNDTNSPFGQWEQTSTSSAGGGQPAFFYKLQASVGSGAGLCLTAVGTVDVKVLPCDGSEAQKWFHPTAVSGPGGTLPTKNVQTKRFIGRGSNPASPVTQFAQIGPHFWAKRTV